MAQLKESPSQTAGPYVHIGCTPGHAGLGGSDLGASMKTGPVQGQEIAVCGTITDGADDPLTDALVEIWQADANGVYPGTTGADPNFTGWGRKPTDEVTGEFRFDTVKPGLVPYPDGRLQAPHVTVWIVARGINLGLHTRLYFADEQEANGTDPILSSIADESRRATLLALPDGPDRYRFDIRLQGADETVFFDM